MIKAIIYDFDGTLVDTLSLHYKAYVYSLSKCGIKADKNTVIDKCFNKQDTEVANSFKIDVDKFSTYYRQRIINDFKNVKLYPNVLSTFKLIKLPIAIGTSRNRRELAPLLDKLQLRSYCNVTVTHDEVKKRKVDIYLKVCKYLKVKPG
jgi:putative hydrolase of the HAD superfamily